MSRIAFDKIGKQKDRIYGRTIEEVEAWSRKAAGSYQELARMFSAYVKKKDAMEQRDRQRIFERVTGRLCRNCEVKSLCWEKNTQQSREAFEEMLEKAQNGELTPEAAPKQLADLCVCREALVEGINLAVSTEQMRLAAYNQMVESKEALVQQLKETANHLTKLPEQLCREVELGALRKELQRELKRYHVRMSELTMQERCKRGRRFRTRLRCESGRSVSVRLIERVMSQWAGYEVKEINRWEWLISEEEKEFVFEEQPEYFVLTGVARLAKQKKTISGDSFSFFYEEDGELAMILSDGMGSGEEAARESEEVLELMERLMEAGFAEETSIRLLNSVLALRAEKGSFATLDMSVINLYTGVSEFVKIAGAPTFIKRRGWLECVEAETLPIGMVQNVDYESLTKKLYDGDYIIMMSDGVADAMTGENGENYLRTVMEEETKKNPQEIAGEILKAALVCQNFEPRDDMTVLVCGVFKRRSRR